MFDKITNYNKAIQAGVFLMPALLLWTPNFSVAVAAVMVLIALTSITKTNITKFDWLVFFCLGFYFISNIPNSIVDLGNFRYFQGSDRLLLCVPLYIFFRQNIVSGTIEAPLILGSIVGSTGAFLIAIFDHYIMHQPRVNGFLYSINFGYLSCSLAFLSLCLVNIGKRRTALIVAFSIASLSTILTITRGAIFAIPMMLAAYYLLYWRHVKIRHIAILLVSLSTISAITVSYNQLIKNRITLGIHNMAVVVQGEKATNIAIQGRIELWKAATKAAELSPIIGLDYTQREELNRKLYKEGKVSKWVTGVERGHAHNQYFEMLASSGALGVIAMISTLFLPCLIFFRHYIKTQCPIAATACVFVLGFIIFGLTEVPLQANLISSYYGFMLALFFAYIHPSNSKLKEKEA